MQVIYKVLGLTADNKLYTKTIARDTKSSAARKYSDDHQNPHDHLVTKNTDFSLIVDRSLECFFENDLPNYNNYMNTSRSIYDAEGNRRWAYPYKSTIVWPIRSIPISNDTSHLDVKCPIQAFLSIDSSSRQAFLERYDVDMGFVLAKSLAPLFYKYSHLQQDSNVN